MPEYGLAVRREDIQRNDAHPVLSQEVGATPVRVAYAAALLVEGHLAAARG